MASSSPSSSISENRTRTNDFVVETKDIFKWFPIKGGLFSRTVANVKAVDGVS